MAAKIFKARQPGIGASPGTLAISSKALEPRIDVYQYSPKKLSRFSPEKKELDALSVTSDSVTWIDIQGFGDRELIESIRERFRLHPLLVEGVINVPQRPKVEQFGDQLLVIVRMVSLNAGGEIQMEQVSFVLGPDYVITFQEKYGDVFDPVRERLENPEGRLRKNRPDYLVYALIDTLVDGYYPVLESIGDQLETLEERVIETPEKELILQLNRLKNRLVNLRRVLWPQREAIGALHDEYDELISDDVRVFFRNLQHHCLYTSEVTEMYREMVTGLMNTYLSSVANRTNDVMKLLTIVATIFTPLTFLAGIYGMNFKYMPELEFWWAYPVFWIVMFFSTLGLLWFFVRKGWLGNQAGSSMRSG